jgi:hypothetical protein
MPLVPHHSNAISRPPRHYGLLTAPSNHVRPMTPTTQLPIISNPSEPALAVKADRIEAGPLPADSIPRWAASHHPCRIKGGPSTSLATPQLFPPPYVVLQASSSMTMSFTNLSLPSSPQSSIEASSAINRRRLGSTTTPPHPHALAVKIPADAGREHTFAKLHWAIHARSTVDNVILSPYHHEPGSQKMLC